MRAGSAKRSCVTITLGLVASDLLEFHTDERVANATREFFPIPAEHQPHWPVDLMVDANSRMYFAIGSGHREAEVAPDAKIDRGARECPPGRFLPPPALQLFRIRFGSYPVN